MSNIAESNRIHQMLPKKVRLELVKAIMEHEPLLHKINDLHIYQSINRVSLINTQTNTLKYFKTEEEAVNYCLDHYKQSKLTEQQKLF